MTALDFPFEIIRSKRRKKTLAIKIEDNIAKVMIPWRVSDKAALLFLQEKQAWVKNRLASHVETLKKYYRNGEVFLYQGEALQLSLIHGNGLVKQEDGILFVYLSENFNGSVESIISQWYFEQAVNVLKARTTHFAEIYGLLPKSVVVKNYKSCWGACSITGDIFYNWKLIMAPKDVLDYVVVHELCHMIEHNHSAQFWEQVDKIFPNHKEHRKWLREFGSSLTLE